MEIYIRPIDIPDALTVMHWENNPDNWEASDNKGEYALYDIVRMIEESMNIHKIRQGRWMICDKSNDELIGTTDLFDIDFEKGEATVGVLVAEKSNRQKGIAYNAVKLLESEAGKLGISRLKCAIHPKNSPSVRLFEKLNFVKIGKTEQEFSHEGEYLQASIYEKWLKK